VVENCGPRRYPSCISNSNNQGVLITTPGDIAQGVFDPEKDVVILSDGTVIENYY